MPDTLSITPLLALSLLTLPVMFTLCPWSIVCAALGDTATTITTAFLSLEHPPSAHANSTPSSTHRTCGIIHLIGTPSRSPNCACMDTPLLLRVRTTPRLPRRDLGLRLSVPRLWTCWPVW